MAYKYNEKTGEFENVPHVSTKTSPVRSTPSTSSSSSRTSSTSSSSGGFWSGLGDVIVGLLPYILGILLAVTCN